MTSLLVMGTNYPVQLDVTALPRPTLPETAPLHTVRTDVDLSERLSERTVLLVQHTGKDKKLFIHRSYYTYLRLINR